MSTYYYVQPTDSLFVRGNLAFGDGGEHGSALMPPPPSLFAGAFRSAILGRDAGEMSAFLQDGHCADARLAACLGTPEVPGEFRITWLSLAGQTHEQALPEALSLFPADLVCLESGFACLQPRERPAGVASSGDLPLLATLVSSKQEKPRSGFYLREAGLRRHLQGELPKDAERIKTSAVHQRDPRLGIGLATESRSAEEGLIYTTEGFAFSPTSSASTRCPYASTGFLVGIEGANELLPDQGQLRLGGDGHSAHYRRVAFEPPFSNAVTGAVGYFRLVLQTPGLFAQGWLPDGIGREGDEFILRGPGFSARLVCAALGRREIISGWDLFNWKPKPAQASSPAGSVYWFDQLHEESPGKLAAWVANGLWAENSASPQAALGAGGGRIRRAEGYNLAWLAAWQN